MTGSAFGPGVRVPEAVHQAQEVYEPAGVTVWEPGDVVWTITAEVDGDRTLLGWRVDDAGQLRLLDPGEMQAAAVAS